MKLYNINTGYFKLDGGAMHGVVPKSLWNKYNPADDNNMCSWALRCLLIEDGNRLILIDNGMGDKQDADFFGYYFLFGNDSLDSSLKKFGFHRDDITDMVLSHLHFDHCGGSIIYDNSKDGYRPAFKNATYWSNENHWLWATKPNARERASFLKENILPIQESGQLKFINYHRSAPGENIVVDDVINNMSVLMVDGHTDGQMIPHISYKGHTIVYMADLLPSVAHIPLPWIMSYDTRPLITLSEKTDFLQLAADWHYILFLEHDFKNECCTLKNTEKGVRLEQCFSLESI